MYSNRRAILSLVAQGRITPAEAERLIAACSRDSEAWWLLAGCAFCAGLIQLHGLVGIEPHAVAGIAQLFRSVLDGTMQSLHHAISLFVAVSGGIQ